MAKFKVSVHGKNYRIGEIRKRYFFRKEYVWRSVGFYTTRFIEAETANEAIEIVFALLRTELYNDGRQTDNSELELQEIQEDENGFDEYAPGGGYTFYTSK